MNQAAIIYLRNFIYTLLIVLPLAACSQGKMRNVKSSNVAYVTGDDKKIYVLDLTQGKVIKTSKPIKGMGKPSDIDIDAQKNLLFIGSERGSRQNTYDPLLVINISNHQFNVVNRFEVEPYFNLSNDPNRLTPLQNSVYSVNISPNGSYLYIGDAAGTDEPLTTILNSQTGEIVDRIDLGINKSYIYSPKGDQVASMFPSGRKSYHENGDKKIREWPSSVAIGDIKSGKWLSTLSITNSHGFHPPWQRITEPFVYLRSAERQLEAYERNSGKLLSKINLIELTGLYPIHTFPITLKGSNEVVLSMIDKQRQGYVIVIDVIEKVVKHKIKVGKMPTNVVLAKVKID